MMKRGLFLLMTVALFGTFAQADSISLTSAKDSYLDEWGPDNNRGGLDSFSVRTGTWRYYGIAGFDLSSLDSTTTAVTGAILNLTSSWSNGTTGTYRLKFYRLLNSWVEGAGSNSPGVGGVSWEYRDNASAAPVTWSQAVVPPVAARDGTYIDYTMQAGVDYDSTSFFTVDLNKADVPSSSSKTFTFDWSSGSALAVVQGWVANPASNYGFFIVPEVVSGDMTQINFRSREWTSASQRPGLNVDYNVTPEPTTMVLLSAGILFVLRRKQR